MPAVLVESTASLSALNGITMLSSNVGDFAFSPVIAARGFNTSFHSNFGLAEAGIFSLAAAERLGYFYVAAGADFQILDDFHRQNQFLSLSLGAENFGIGLSQHVAYQRTGEASAVYEWSWDAAFRGEAGGYGSEIRLLRLGSADQEVHLTGLTRVSPEIAVASTYVWGKDGYKSFRTGTSFRIMDILEFYSSWQNNPSRLGAGLSLRIDSVRLGYGIRTHDSLSLSHSFDLGYSW